MCLGLGLGLEPLALSVGADGFFALAAPFFFFCAGDAAAAGVVEAAGAAALAHLAALALCLVSEAGLGSGRVRARVWARVWVGFRV